MAGDCAASASSVAKHNEQKRQLTSGLGWSLALLGDFLLGGLGPVLFVGVRGVLLVFWLGVVLVAL